MCNVFYISKSYLIRNFGLLSFGNEAEEDEEETNDFVQRNSGKAKSTHDLLTDPKLSKETATFVKLGKSQENKTIIKTLIILNAFYF